MNKLIVHLKDAAGIVFSSRAYVVLGVSSFAAFFILYAFVLPATYTGGHIGLVSLQFLNFRLGVFAFLFSLALALIIPFATYAFRKKSSQKTLATTGSFFGSVLPPLLCCSPLLPSLAALAGGVFPFVFGVSGFLQGFIATYETQIYTGIVILLAYSVWQNAKQVIAAECNVCEH